MPVQDPFITLAVFEQDDMHPVREDGRLVFVKPHTKAWVSQPMAVSLLRVLDTV